MSDLSSAKIGTKIRIPAEYSSGFSIGTVTRITKTQVVCGNYRFRISDGRLVGSSGFRTRYAHLANDTDIFKARIAKANRELKSLSISEEELEAAELLISRIKAKEKS